VSMSRKVCEFQNRPGGCRRGAQCKFLHTNPAGGSNPSGSSPSTPKGKGKGKANVPSTPQPTNGPKIPCPRDACRLFWDTGKCKFGNGCRYRHVNQTSQGPVTPGDNADQNAGAAAETSSAAATLDSEVAAERLLDYLTPDALARLTAGTDIYFTPEGSDTLPPEEIRGKLRMYLRDQYRFEKTFHVYSMMGLLSSASSRNAGWVSAYFFTMLQTLANVLIVSRRRTGMAIFAPVEQCTNFS
jgi:hypothetical protein